MLRRRPRGRLRMTRGRCGSLVLQHMKLSFTTPRRFDRRTRSTFMSQEKYIGMDVHQATISVAVRDVHGKLIMECVLETKAATILEFIQGLRGTLALTFEEGTLAAWLHDLLKPHVSRLVVCDPRKNALMRMATRTIGWMHAIWRSYYAPTKSRRCTTGSTGP